MRCKSYQLRRTWTTRYGVQILLYLCDIHNRCFCRLQIEYFHSMNIGTLCHASGDSNMLSVYFAVVADCSEDDSASLGQDC